MSTRASFRWTDEAAVLLPLTSLYPTMPQWLAAMKVASVTVAAFAETNEAWRVLSSGVRGSQSSATIVSP
jgi:hypothetical protein